MPRLANHAESLSNRVMYDVSAAVPYHTIMAAADLVGKSDVEVRAAIGDKFPKHIYHSIVCVGQARSASKAPQTRASDRRLAAAFRTFQICPKD